MIELYGSGLHIPETLEGRIVILKHEEKKLLPYLGHAYRCTCTIDGSTIRVVPMDNRKNPYHYSGLKLTKLSMVCDTEEELDKIIATQVFMALSSSNRDIHNAKKRLYKLAGLPVD